MGYHITVGKITGSKMEDDFEYPIFEEFNVPLPKRMCSNTTHLTYTAGDPLLKAMGLDPSGTLSLIELDKGVIDKLHDYIVDGSGKAPGLYDYQLNTNYETWLTLYEALKRCDWDNPVHIWFT
jgi:hypothetical protein